MWWSCSEPVSLPFLSRLLEIGRWGWSESEDGVDRNVVDEVCDKLGVEVERELEGVCVKSCMFWCPIFSEFLDEWASSSCIQYMLSASWALRHKAANVVGLPHRRISVWRWSWSLRKYWSWSADLFQLTREACSQKLTLYLMICVLFFLCSEFMKCFLGITDRVMGTEIIFQLAEESQVVPHPMCRDCQVIKSGLEPTESWTFEIR